MGCREESDVERRTQRRSHEAGELFPSSDVALWVLIETVNYHKHDECRSEELSGVSINV